MFRNIVAIVAASRMVRMNLPIKGDFPILEIDGSDPMVITLPMNADTASNGIQSLFFDNREGHLLVAPLERDDPRTRRFRVIKNLGAQPEIGKKVWLSGWLGNRPEDFDVEKYQTVKLTNGTQAWVTKADSKNWVIHVHGRKASRAETLRTFPLFAKKSFNQITISHETDSLPDGLGKPRSDLGISEWRQIEFAFDFALKNGADSIVLYGWSMGALICGEFLKNSSNARRISGLIFDSPLLDYPSTIRLQSVNAGLSAEFGSLVLKKLKSSWILELLGLSRKELPDLIRNLEVPVLLMFSKQDGYVSMARLEEFTALNPQAMAVEFVGARHCRLFNANQAKYESEILKFLEEL